jgi:hypothetical protein
MTNFLKPINWLASSSQNLYKTINSYLRRVKRLIEFVPKIWRGYDFDYHHSLDLFKYQLERTAKVLENGYRADGAHQASRIRTAIKLIDLVYNEEYSAQADKEFSEKYGHCNFDWKLDETSGMYSLDLRWESAIDDAHNEEIQEEFSKAMHDAYDKAERAEDLLWRFIRHNIKRWWD